MDTQAAPTVLTIDLGALAKNYAVLQEQAGRVQAASVIKANGYGLGIEKVGQTLQSAGCRSFFVANTDEGVALRNAIGKDAHIYVIGGVLAGDASAFPAYDLIPVLNSLEDVATWRDKGNKHAAAIHFDTGMSRLGLCADETLRVLNDPTLLDDVNITMGMSHFASSEDPDDPLNQIQIERFRAITSRLTLPAWSFCNTSAIFRFKDNHYDLVRCGYGLYGGNPLPHLDNPMHDVVKLEARVLQVKPAKAGESVGYNATYILEDDDELAVIALGYADGHLRSQSSCGHVYWNGQACPITGRVSMDLTTVRIGHLPGPRPKAGDMLEILGSSQGVDALAAGANTNGYEILTRLGPRYHRRYINAL